MLLTHLGQNAQPYIYQSVIPPSRPERVPWAEERASGRGKNEPSGRGESLGRRKEPAAVCSSDESSLSSRDQTSGGVLHLTEENARSRVSIDTLSCSVIIHLGQSAAVHLSMNHSSISEGGMRRKMLLRFHLLLYVNQFMSAILPRIKITAREGPSQSVSSDHNSMVTRKGGSR